MKDNLILNERYSDAFNLDRYRPVSSLIIRPNEESTVSLEPNNDNPVIAIAAGFRDIGRASWIVSINRENIKGNDLLVKLSKYEVALASKE